MLNWTKKIAKNNNAFFILDLKDATGKINARGFTNNINEFEKLVDIYSIGNLLSVTGE